MKRFVCLALLLLLSTVGLRAQASSRSVQGQLTAASAITACPGVGCVTLFLAGSSNVALQVSCTYSGTVSFEGTIENTNWVALNMTPLNSATAASSTTSTGVWQSVLVGGLTAVRARMSSYTSGQACINIQSTP